MPSQNINAGTVTPIINPEWILVDSDLDSDLEEIQRKAVAEQVWIEEAAQARLAAACERIEKKWKAKEEEAQKAEEVRKAEEAWKVEETLVVKRHWMMRKGKELERNPEVVAGNVPEVEPEATCD